MAGLVFDSLADVPLADARVQLVDANHLGAKPTTLTTDSLGRFASSDIAPGRYIATFFHPRLDVLALQAATVLLDLRGPHGLWIDLAIPSPAHLKALLCGQHALLDSTGLLMGRALDATTRRPLYGAVVRAEWLDLDVRLGDGVRFGRPHTEVLSRTDGEFVLCDLPMVTDVSVQASHPGKRSGQIGVHMPPGGVAVRDLFLADTHHVVLHGNVLGANGSPIPRARVSVANTHTEALADENGIFALPVDRAGTQTIVARAIGFYQEEKTVDVLPDSTQWVELELPTMVSVLDTVHV
ncbi:MAG: carboxypeptidase regulatory-like domain-containing protein, partial [Gemmatimonadaceae bacterium]